MNWERVWHVWNEYRLVDYTTVAIICVLSSLVLSFSRPYCRPFSWDDKTIDYPYVTDVAFPLWTLFLFLGLAILVYSAVVIFLGGSVWSWIKTQLFALFLQQVPVSMLKIYAGRLRPDYLNRLRHLGFDENSHLVGAAKDSDAKEYYCMLGDKYPVLRDGRLSFPSGHSSTSFSVFVLVSIFLFVHLRPFSREGSFVRLLLSLSPLSIAFLCALSRTRDYWHNFDDVVAGAIIGTVSAILSFYNTFRITSGGVCVVRCAEASSAGGSAEATGSPCTGVV